MDYLKGYDSWKLMTPEDDRSEPEENEDDEKGRLEDLKYESDRDDNEI